MYWPVTSHWIVRENHALTCHKSPNCAWKPCADLSQVTKLLEKTIHWPVTSHWIVRENHVLTCDKSLNCAWNHALTCHKSSNCAWKPCTDLSQVTEFLEKTMLWPVRSHWIVRENHALTCHRSLNCAWNHALTYHKSENCERKPCSDLSQVTELWVKTMHWSVASHWILR